MCCLTVCGKEHIKIPTHAHRRSSVHGFFFPLVLLYLALSPTFLYVFTKESKRETAILCACVCARALVLVNRVSHCVRALYDMAVVVVWSSAVFSGRQSSVALHRSDTIAHTHTLRVVS